MATPHAFDFILVVNARADDLPVLLLVPCDRAAWAVPVTKLCLVAQESLNQKSYDFRIWVKHEPLRLGVAF